MMHFLLRSSQQPATGYNVRAHEAGGDPNTLRAIGTDMRLVLSALT